MVSTHRNRSKPVTSNNSPLNHAQVNMSNEDGNNYRIDTISHVDVPNRVVVCPFECLISGREGTGTEFLRMDPSGKFVEGAKCVRHASWE